MCQTKSPLLTASAVSLRSVITIRVVWPPSLTPAEMPFFTARNPSHKMQMQAKHKEPERWAEWGSLCHWGRERCYHRVMSSCWACFVKECQCWFKTSPSPSLRHALWMEYHAIFWRNYSHTCAHRDGLKTPPCRAELPITEVENTMSRPHTHGFLSSSTSSSPVGDDTHICYAALKKSAGSPLAQTYILCDTENTYQRLTTEHTLTDIHHDNTHTACSS